MKFLMFLLVLSVTSGCASIGNVQQDNSSVSIVMGPLVTNNNTPYSTALYCLNKQILKVDGAKRYTVSVSDVPDHSGRFSEEDNGYRVTQGAALMVSSALGKLDFIDMVERTNVDVFKFELDLADLGKKYKNPIHSGSVVSSDYFITGGITEVNFNIRSGGVEGNVAGYFAGARQYVMNIAVDLRIVERSSLRVVKTISKQKQIIGYETKAGLFKFFGQKLFDINSGDKSHEPLQLGVRAVIETSVVSLISSLYNIDPNFCVNFSEELFKKELDRDNAQSLFQNPQAKVDEAFRVEHKGHNRIRYYALNSSFKQASSVRKQWNEIVAATKHHPNYPRSYELRKIGNRNALYIGPYSSKQAVQSVCKLIKHHKKNTECIIKEEK